MNEIDAKYVGKSRKGRLFGIGICMGIANVIPGVSGGTIAFLFEIYEDLITAIRGFDLTLAARFWKRQWREILDGVPWRFMVTVFAGVFTAVFTLAGLMSWLLDNQQIYVYAFFFGLILATVPIIGRVITHWTRSVVIWGVLSTIAMFLLVGMVPLNTPESLWFVFFCGAVAVCTMILPGISGSFVLVVLGKYEYIIDCIARRDILPLIVFTLGCVVGILAFIRVLSWLLKHYHNRTMIVLTGLVLGSLRKIWPWKSVLAVTYGRHGKIIPAEEINVLPEHWTPEVLGALALCVIGFGLAWRLGDNRKKERLKAG